MNNTNAYFCRRLRGLLTIPDFRREELARYAGASAETVCRWENGEEIPDVYQFRDIASFFGLPYDWFLDEPDSQMAVWDMAQRLGLSQDTMALLVSAAESGPETVRSALDDAIYFLAAAVEAARGDAEDV